MKGLTPAIAIIIIACFATQTWQPALAGTWLDDFEDKDTREWKIFNLDRQVEKWWVSDGEAVDVRAAHKVPFLAGVCLNHIFQKYCK